MKKLFFIGKAPPADKSRHNTPFPCAGLTDLVALDPRHGVFPNLVAMPLLSTIMAFHETGKVGDVFELLNQAKEILTDKSPRRMNVLLKPTTTDHRLAPEIVNALSDFQPEKTLWLVFKHSSVFALCAHLLTGGCEFSEAGLNIFGARFLAACVQAPNCPFKVPRNKNTQVGLLFRLCTDEDPKGDGAVSFLRHAVQKIAPKVNADRVTLILRSFVPLLHNDAYDRRPVGLIQARFMAMQDLPTKCPTGHVPAVASYWRLIGTVTARRLQPCS